MDKSQKVKKADISTTRSDKKTQRGRPSASKSKAGAGSKSKSASKAGA